MKALTSAVLLHTAGTTGGVQTRWGICSCGWTGEEHRGVLAERFARLDADEHVAWTARQSHVRRTR